MSAIEPAATPGRAANAIPSPVAATPAAQDAHRGRLFRKYLLLILSLVSLALLASGGISLVFMYRETTASLAGLQREKAIGAASRIEQYLRLVTQQLEYAALPQLGAGDLELRRIEFLKLLRQVPEVTDIALIDADGRELIAESRLGMSALASGRDRSGETAFREARRGEPWFGPVTFRKETEPYMTVAIRSGGERPLLTVAELNLKFIWDVISRIKIGAKGKAYVVDRDGFLVADPDIGLVLRKTQLGALEHVKTMTAAPSDELPALQSLDLAGTRVLASMAPIESLGWRVFVEQPASEVYARLNQSIVWTAGLLLAGLAVSALAAGALARSMVRPIATLDAGARRIGEGDLDQRIEVRTGDELEGLADRFNRMSAQLRESYAGLERKVEQRTAEVTEALEYQTAISEVLRVISRSPAEVGPVFEAIMDSAQRLFSTAIAAVFRYDGRYVHLVGTRGWSQAELDDAKRLYPAPPNPQMLSGRTLLTGTVQTIADMHADPSYDRRTAEIGQWRRMIGAPMMKDGVAVGVIVVAWPESGESPLRQVELLKSFADQAVIAIENARLINETREALEQQTATAEVLQVISNSVADTKPVFEKILESCERLFASGRMSIFLIGGDDRLHLGAYRGPDAEALAGLYPTPLGSTWTETAIRERRVLHFPDVLAAPDAPAAVRRVAKRVGHSFSQIQAPMLWEGRGVGSILVTRDATGPFSDKEIELLRTFADQAVIAIQNARLFHEIEDKGRQLELANKHKSEFLANMSHELRTPLNAIIGFSEVLAEQMFGAVNAKQLEYLRDIHSSGQHLLGLINDILDLSKIEAGRMELDLGSFHVPLLLDNSATLVRERAIRHGLALAVEVEEGLAEWVGDERKIKQVVINLLSNAVKFTPAGGSVTLRARRVAAGLEIAVVDTGVGIAADQQALVFEAFRQASGDHLRKAEGTGLGLSLARRFVELHGGTIRVESAPGRGSTFAFVLPERAMEAAA